MEFKELHRIFDQDFGLTELVETIVQEDESVKKQREIINSAISKFKETNPEEALSLESAINEVICKNGMVYLPAGWVLGQSFTLVNPKAQAEVEYLNIRMKNGGLLPFWSK